MDEPTVADVYLYKASAADVLGVSPTELTMHPYRWGRFEAELESLGSDVKRETRIVDGEERIVLEDLLVCFDIQFPTDQILVS
jgi:hypothetical protein